MTFTMTDRRIRGETVTDKKGCETVYGRVLAGNFSRRDAMDAAQAAYSAAVNSDANWPARRDAAHARRMAAEK